jgi:hypothetical protein
MTSAPSTGSPTLSRTTPVTADVGTCPFRLEAISRVMTATDRMRNDGIM